MRAHETFPVHDPPHVHRFALVIVRYPPNTFPAWEMTAGWRPCVCGMTRVEYELARARTPAAQVAAALGYIRERHPINLATRIRSRPSPDWYAHGSRG